MITLQRPEQQSMYTQFGGRSRLSLVYAKPSTRTAQMLIKRRPLVAQLKSNSTLAKNFKGHSLGIVLLRATYTVELPPHHRQHQEDVKTL